MKVIREIDTGSAAGGSLSMSSRIRRACTAAVAGPWVDLALRFRSVREKLVTLLWQLDENSSFFKEVMVLHDHVCFYDQYLFLNRPQGLAGHFRSLLRLRHIKIAAVLCEQLCSRYAEVGVKYMSCQPN